MKRNTLTNQQMKSQQTRESIYAAAVRLLEKYGYAYLTVRNICEEAELSIGTFYHHFTNKDDLLAVFISDGYLNYAKTRHHGAIEDVCEAIWINLDDYISYHLETDFDFVCKYHSTDNKTIDTRNKHSDKELARTPLVGKTIDLVARGQKAGHITRALPAGEIADDIITIAKGLIFDWCLTDAAMDLKKVARRLIKIYLAAIVTEQYRAEYSFVRDAIA